MKIRQLLALSIIALSASTAAAQTYQTSHFKFWRVEEMPIRKKVTLQGQFDKLRWTAETTAIAFIGNPVQKNDEPVPDKTTHLLAYALLRQEKPQPQRWVAISNQVTKEARLLLGDPALLLIPAAKAIAPKEPGKVTMPLDHFLCYVVLDPPTMAKEYRLLDQFDALQKRPERVSQLRPAYFCVPVSKNGEEIPDRKTHLTLYALAPRTPLKPVVPIITRDQFGLAKLRALESFFLGVPTLKNGWGAK